MILDYFTSVGPGDEIESMLAESMSVGLLVYEYQLYQIIEWFYDRGSAPPATLLDFVREVGFKAASPNYLKRICWAVLGKFGEAADLERLALLYDETNDNSQRVDIICSIRRMERGRRNGLYARFQDDGEQNRLAVRWARSGAA